MKINIKEKYLKPTQRQSTGSQQRLERMRRKWLFLLPKPLRSPYRLRDMTIKASRKRGRSDGFCSIRVLQSLITLCFRQFKPSTVWGLLKRLAFVGMSLLIAKTVFGRGLFVSVHRFAWCWHLVSLSLSVSFFLSLWIHSMKTEKEQVRWIIL